MTGGNGEAKNASRNLVKRGKETISAQVLENAAKINLRNMSQSPSAGCYSEYIE
jgi:hypothetical protein